MVIGEKYFEIGEHTYFGKMAVLTAWDNYEGVTYKPKVIIGHNCGFNDFIHLSCIGRIEIGTGVRVGRWVSIIDNAHGKATTENLKLQPNKRILYSKGPICIEDRVWIGDKCTILSGVTIGEGSIIAANSVVTKNIPSYCIAAGNPAVVIKLIGNE